MKLLVLGPRARRWFLPWCLALAALANLAYPMYQHYDFSHSLDTRSYLRLASGRFDSVNVTRRYRVLVPAAAAVVAAPVAKLYGRIWPQRPAGHWPLRFAFYLVNCAILALAGAYWFNASRLAGSSPEAAALAMLAVLSSRWAEYSAGLPLTDSLYLLVFGLGYYAYRRGPGAGAAVALALLLGPLAKESFFFLLPWLLWFCRPALAWPRQLAALAIGLGALGAVHYFIDEQAHAAATDSVSNAVGHLENLGYSLRRAASSKGIGELLSVFGFFTFIPLLTLWLFKNQAAPTATRWAWYHSFNWADGWLLLIVGIHMALSGYLGRMGYLAAPVFTTALALAFTHWRQLIRR